MAEKNKAKCLTCGSDLNVYTKVGKDGCAKCAETTPDEEQAIGREIQYRATFDARPPASAQRLTAA